MNFKIIPIAGCDSTESVLLSFFIDDEGCGVCIECWHKVEESETHQQESISFELENSDSISAAKRFIADYSAESANEFANSFFNKPTKNDDRTI